jgi:hypothetical protein
VIGTSSSTTIAKHGRAKRGNRQRGKEKKMKAEVKWRNGSKGKAEGLLIPFAISPLHLFP